MKRILVTGNLGYIGIILTEELIKQNYEVVGIDTGYYNDKVLYDFESIKDVQQIKKDIRNISADDLRNIDSIIHLAALSNDPLGEIDPQLTEKINYQSTIKLAQLAKSAKVPQFLFSSSCSVYGNTTGQALAETDPADPLTAYAISKVKSEQNLSKLADETFSPVYLRNATAYGISPNMRFDLVVNNLMGWGYCTKKINILSNGKAWRPICHVRDIANAFIAVLKAPREVVHNEIFNVGINSENYQVKSMAECINKKVLDTEIQILGKDNPDERNYIVNFDKIKKKLKHFNPKWNLEKGINELNKCFNSIALTLEIFQDRTFTRVKQIKYLIQNNLLNNDLYWN